MASLVYIVVTGLVLSCEAAGRRWSQPSADRHNYFDTDLFEELNSLNRDENILVSPLSVKVTLGMILEGTKGSTAEEIRKAMRLPSDIELARETFHRWLRSLQPSKTTSIIQIANQLFVDEKFKVRREYRETLRNTYQADTTQVSFASPSSAAAKINKWVSNSTKGLIPSLVDEGSLPSSAKMLIANAVYFKGRWASPFEKERTAPACFYSKRGVCTQTNMMIQNGMFNYAYISRLDAEALDMPYEDGKYSMLLLLPKSMDGIYQLGRDLVHVFQEHILSQMEQNEVFIQIPRFEVDYQKDLINVLKALRVSDLFSSSADFSKMVRDGSNETLTISDIIHSAKIIVNEEGSEAAAATGAMFVPLIGNPAILFTADRPFYFSIRDTETGTVLFEGRVIKPSVASQPKPSTQAPTTTTTPANAILGEEQVFIPNVNTQPPHILVSTSEQKPYNPRPAGPVQQPRPTYTQPSKPFVNNQFRRPSQTRSRGGIQDEYFMFDFQSQQAKTPKYISW